MIILSTQSHIGGRPASAPQCPTRPTEMFRPSFSVTEQALATFQCRSQRVGLLKSSAPVDNYAAAAPAPSSAAAKAVAFARAQLGTPYVWGGNGPADGGFDCSGLTQAAYRTAGISIPRVAQAQYDQGPRLPKGAPLAAGDLLFFGTSSGNITHVSLYTGGGRAVDAPHSGVVVREGPANTDTASFQGATRPTARGGAW